MGLVLDCIVSLAPHILTGIVLVAVVFILRNCLKDEKHTVLIKMKCFGLTIDIKPVNCEEESSRG